MGQPGGREVLPAEGGHPQGPSDQRAYHQRLRHEGQVHQAHPQEGLQVREQVRQAAGEGRQVRVRQPAEGEVKCVLTAFKNMPRTADTKHIPRRFIKTICSRGNINIYTDIYRYLHTWISSNRHQHSQSSTVDKGFMTPERKKKL